VVGEGLGRDLGDQDVGAALVPAVAQGLAQMVADVLDHIDLVRVGDEAGDLVLLGPEGHELDRAPGDAGLLLELLGQAALVGRRADHELAALAVAELAGEAAVAVVGVDEALALGRLVVEDARVGLEGAGARGLARAQRVGDRLHARDVVGGGPATRRLLCDEGRLGEAVMLHVGADVGRGQLLAVGDDLAGLAVDVGAHVLHRVGSQAGALGRVARDHPALD
jgi:hypothetical protein